MDWQERDRHEYVAEKMSRLSATFGKKAANRNGVLLVRKVRLEGLMLGFAIVVA
jgi:hypothetical protein